MENEPIICPICGKNPDEDQCSHLAFHGDDLLTSDVLAETGPEGCWEKLETLAPEFLPESASEFFDEFGHHFPSLAKVMSDGWTGGAPGLSGNYCFVWAKHSGKLMDEIYLFLDSEMRKRNSAKSRLKPGTTNSEPQSPAPTTPPEQ